MFFAVVNHLWQSTLFAGGVAVLALVLRRNGATICFGLWFSASVKFLIPFALLGALGSHLPRHPPNLSGVPGPAQVFATVIGTIASPLSMTRHVLNAPSGTATPGNLVAGLLGMVWACGALTMVAYWFAGWRRIRRALRASIPTAIEFPIPVRSSSVMQEPAVAGILRPTLLVPDAIQEWLSPAQFQAVLAHEHCHVQRRDNLMAACHMLVEALFWFYPLVWWLGRRLIAERERACDEEVLAGAVKAKDYAAAILRVCQHYLESPLRCAAGVGGGDLTRRIEFILNRPRRARMSALRIMLLVGFASVVVAGPIVSGSSAALIADERESSRDIFKNYVAVIPDKGPPSDGETFINAAGSGNLDEVKRLLRKGVDVEFTNGAVTALTQAAQHACEGCEAVVQELIANGARVDHSRNGGETALALAAASGALSIVESLLIAGAQVNDQDSNGHTALMAASANGHHGVVLLLLSHGADVNRETVGVGSGDTALLLAARGGYDRVVRLLLDSGADYRHRQFDGETALDLAVQGRQVAVVQALLAKGAGSAR